MPLKKDNFYLEDFNYPTRVRLEACTLCQLDCAECYMRLYKNSSLGAGYLKLDDFVKFLNLNPYIKEIDLAYSGEIFLNPELGDIIKYAYSKNVSLTADSGVNFNDVSDDLLECMVKYRFRYLKISIDGWNQESYEKYRRNGNFNKVIANIKRLNEFKQRYSSDLPELTWKYVIFEHTDNPEGASIAKKLSEDLGFKDFRFSRAWDGYLAKNINKAPGVKSLYSGTKVYCSQLWMSPQINWDGRFFGCCINHETPYNDESLFEIPLSEYLERPIIKNTKQMLMGQACSGECNPYCQKLCHHYTVMKAEKHFISENDLASGKVMKVTI